MAHSTGELITKRYRVVKLLGQGGMGAVYRAWDLSLNNPVAIKEMLLQPGLEPAALAQLRAQFRQEAQVLARLNHPCLPRVIDFFEFDGKVYLVMDFIEGESLDKLIDRHGRLPEGQVVMWLVQLLEALAVCHDNRILHRDIKPQNIIIRPDGRPVLVDFGLVKFWDPRNPRTQQIVRGMGTPEYASPEHFAITGHTQPRSDLYSLAATFYHALMGSEPPSAIERFSSTQNLAPLQASGVRVAPNLERVLFCAMALQLDQRFPNAREMAAALTGSGGRVIVQPASAQLRPYSPPQPAQSQIGPAVNARVGSFTPIAHQASARPATTDARWLLEMGTAMVMALVGTLTLQWLHFPTTALLQFVGLGIGALVLGGIGWFLGDTLFQMLTQPVPTPGSGASTLPSSGGRPTRQLAALTQNLTRNLTPVQQAGLLIVLVVIAVLGAWVIGPKLMAISWLWNNLPSYALAGPLVYAAVGRRSWRTIISHVLVTTLGGIVLSISAGTLATPWGLLGGSVVGGLLMEGIAFISEHTLLKRETG